MTNKKTGQPTITDVADAAGVSRATASRALSNYGRINQSTKEHVSKVAAELGYRPNSLAQAMRRGRTKTIGLVIVTDVTNTFFGLATKAIIDAARAKGYQVLISHTDEDVNLEREAVNTLIDKQVDGLIVLPSSTTDYEHLSAKSLQGKPVVLVDRTIKGLRASSVTTDDYSGCVDAVKYAYSMGHRKFAFLIAIPNMTGHSSTRPKRMLTVIDERVSGFARGCVEVDPNAKHSWRFTEDAFDSSEDAVRSMLDEKKAPTVFFTSNNDMVLAIMKVANQLSLKIGKDISVVTVDDSQWAIAMVPALTVVSRPITDLGTISVDQLISEIDSRSSKTKSIRLPTRLIARDSVAKVK